MEGYYSEQEMETMGFRSFGKDVLLSRKASFYGAKSMSFGDNVRVDDYCIFIGNITLRSHIHIGGFCGLHASMGSITMDDFSTLSSNVTIYAASDDYSGRVMTNAVIPEVYKNTHFSDIRIEKHVIIGTGSTLLPDASVGEGAAVGAMSLVNKPIESWGIYAGIPCRRINDRSRELLQMEKEFTKNDVARNSFILAK
ncbi:MAG: acyltransferase [Clostridia bacterium]